MHESRGKRERERGNLYSNRESSSEREFVWEKGRDTEGIFLFQQRVFKWDREFVGKRLGQSVCVRERKRERERISFNSDSGSEKEKESDGEIKLIDLSHHLLLKMILLRVPLFLFHKRYYFSVCYIILFATFPFFINCPPTQTSPALSLSRT